MNLGFAATMQSTYRYPITAHSTIIVISSYTQIDNIKTHLTCTIELYSIKFWQGKIICHLPNFYVSKFPNLATSLLFQKYALYK